MQSSFPFHLNPRFICPLRTVQFKLKAKWRKITRLLQTTALKKSNAICVMMLEIVVLLSPAAIIHAHIAVISPVLQSKAHKEISCCLWQLSVQNAKIKCFGEIWFMERNNKRENNLQLMRNMMLLLLRMRKLYEWSNGMRIIGQLEKINLLCSFLNGCQKVKNFCYWTHWNHSNDKKDCDKERFFTFH